MGIRYEHRDGLAELTIEGEVSVSAIVDRLEGCRDDETCPGPLLINVAESLVLPVGPELRRIGEAIVKRQRVDKAPVAVWVTRTVRYGLARQLGIFLEAEGIPLEPFTDRDEAVAWLTAGETGSG